MSHTGKKGEGKGGGGGGRSCVFQAKIDVIFLFFKEINTS